jgi:hypothetical protein
MRKSGAQHFLLCRQNSNSALFFIPDKMRQGNTKMKLVIVAVAIIAIVIVIAIALCRLSWSWYAFGIVFIFLFIFVFAPKFSFALSFSCECLVLCNCVVLSQLCCRKKDKTRQPHFLLSFAFVFCFCLRLFIFSLFSLAFQVVITPIRVFQKGREMHTSGQKKIRPGGGRPENQYSDVFTSFNQYIFCSHNIDRQNIIEIKKYIRAHVVATIWNKRTTERKTFFEGKTFFLWAQ